MFLSQCVASLLVTCYHTDETVQASGHGKYDLTELPSISSQYSSDPLPSWITSNETHQYQDVLAPLSCEHPYNAIASPVAQESTQ